MRYVSAALLCATLMFTNTAAFAETDEADKARIQLLEDQVTQLKAEVRRLRLMTSEMQTRLNQVNIILHDLQQPEKAELSDEEADCQQRLADAHKTRDKLISLGYKAGHPDVVNVSALLEQLEKECKRKQP